MRTGEATRDWAEQRGLNCVYQTTTGSTNDDAKNAAHDRGENFKLFVASHQSAGRGRGMHHWVDGDHDHYLLSTWSYALSSPPQAITGPRAGWALYQAVRKIWPDQPWALKAPNDLFLGPNKVAGLLIESVSIGSNHRLIVGLGLNVGAHPGEVQGSTDLSVQLGRPISFEEWCWFLDALASEFGELGRDAMRAELRPQVRAGLCRALNLFPNLPNPILEVSPHGDLITTGGTIRWKEL